MKITLMDTKRLVNLILPKDVFGNYWVTNYEKENLVSVEARDKEWFLKSNSDVKILRNGNVINEVLLEYERFYTLKNIILDKSYVIYTCRVYETNTLQLTILNPNREQNQTWYIGNNSEQSNTSYPNIISYEQPGFFGNQLMISSSNGKYSITNLNASIPMYVNGMACVSSELDYGDTVFLLGLKLSIIKDIFFINNPNKLVRFDSQFFVLRQLPKLDYTRIPIEADPVIEMYKKEDYFLKPPRFDERIEEKELVIDPPPNSQKQEEMPAIFQMGSMMMMGMTSMMTGVTTFISVLNGTMQLSQALPSILTTLAMLICMMILPSVSRMYTKHRKKVYERKRQATYSMYVNKKREEFLTEMKKEQQILVEKYIPLKEVGDIILYKKRNLWEKNIGDYDFLTIR